MLSKRLTRCVQLHVWKEVGSDKLKTIKKFHGLENIPYLTGSANAHLLVERSSEDHHGDFVIFMFRICDEHCLC